MSLTDKQERFCNEYLANNMNATKAYMTVYGVGSENVAAASSAKLLRNAKVSEYLSSKQKVINDKVGIRQEDLAAELKKVAFTNITDFVTIEDFVYTVENPDTGEDERKAQRIVIIKETSEISPENIGAISGIKQGKYGIELTLHDKLRAIEMLGRHSGLFEKDNLQKKPESATLETILSIAEKINQNAKK